MNPFSDILSSTSTPGGRAPHQQHVNSSTAEAEQQQKQLSNGHPPLHHNYDHMTPNTSTATPLNGNDSNGAYVEAGSCSTPPPLDGDELIAQFALLQKRNMRLKRAQGTLNIDLLSQQIKELELENHSLAEKYGVCLTPDSSIIGRKQLRTTGSIPSPPSPFSQREGYRLSIDSAYGERNEGDTQDHSTVEEEDGARWWNLKKRFQSLSIGRYSIATTRLSVAGQQGQGQGGDTEQAGGLGGLRNSGMYGAPRPSEWRRSVEGIHLRPSSSRVDGGAVDRRSSAATATATTTALGAVGSLGDDQPGNFVEYYTIGVDANIFNGTTAPEVDLFQPAKVLHKFPDASTPPFIEDIAEFMFPGGMLPLYLLIDVKANSLKTGSSFDQFQVMQFSDASGQPTYACCMITTETVSDPSTELIRNLNSVQAQLLAATIITKFFKGIVIYKRSRSNTRLAEEGNMRRFSDFYTRGRNRSATSPTINSTGKREGGMMSSFTNMVFGMVASNKKKQEQREAAGSGVGTELSPSRRGGVGVGSGSSGSSSSRKDPYSSFAAQLSGLLDDDSAVSETSSRSISLCSEHTTGGGGEPGSPLRGMNSFGAGGKVSFSGSEPNNSISISSPRTSGRLTRSNSIRRVVLIGNELTATSNTPDATTTTTTDATTTTTDTTDAATCASGQNSRHVVITQRGYCIISNNPFYAFLFKLLQEISAIYRSNGIAIENSASTLLEYGHNVNSLLDVAQYVNLYKSLYATSSGGEGVGGKGGAEGVRQQESRLLNSISFSYRCEHRGVYTFNASLKSCSHKSFILGILFTLIPYTVLIDVMNHILLERSLLICGKHAPLVSIIATGVTYLLTPLVWDGVFVALLPVSAMEVLQAPVPRILGIPLCTPRQGELVAQAVSASEGDMAVLNIDNGGSSSSSGGSGGSDMFPAVVGEVGVGGRSRDKRSSSSSSVYHYDNTNGNNSNSSSSSGMHWSLSSPHEDDLRCSLRAARGLVCNNTHCCRHKYDLGRVLDTASTPTASADTPAGTTGHSKHSRCSVLTHDAYAMNVFMNHVLYHMDPATSAAIDRVHSIIRMRHEAMLGDVLHTDMWKRYGLTHASGAFEYYPQWLLDHRVSIHKFQKNLFYTQHFSSFMHRLYREYTQNANTRYYVACWIYRQIQRIKKSKKK